ncbi:hypothetical protein KFE25_004354 [Diacronema lutheri]|uniref:Uncharacterized protein n=1 Tax=Diacronema lutheri TaxID=2081491 RepID=A0A8J5X4Z0_DIALT|nr:hypothetical protein KFE25_004354 [Diacronema lutheri]
MSAEQTETERRFLREPLPDAVLVPGVVPGVGAKNVQKLADQDVRSAQQLMGYYCLLNRDAAVFTRWLQGCDIQQRYVQVILHALASKSAEFCTDEVPVYPRSPPRGADGSTTAIHENFARSPLWTGKIVPGQVPGLGAAGIARVAAAVVTRLASSDAASVPSAVQLLGLFLALGRDASQFNAFLTTDCGCQPQHARRTVEALQSKAESICDAQTAGTSTPTTQRTGSRLESTPEVASAVRGVGADEAAVVAQVASTRSSLGWLLLLGALVAAVAVLARAGGYP